MAKADNHIITLAVLAGGAALAYFNRHKLEGEFATLVAGTAAQTAAQTAAAIPAPTQSSLPPIVVTPPQPTISTADITAAITAAMNSAGYSSGNIPTSAPLPVQTPYGPVIPSSGVNPDLLPAPIVTPTGGSSQTPSTPAQTSAAIQTGAFSVADIARELASYSQNLSDYKEATGNPNPNNPASAAPAYMANATRSAAQLNYWFQVNPALFSGLNTKPWK